MRIPKDKPVDIDNVELGARVSDHLNGDRIWPLNNVRNREGCLIGDLSVPAGVIDKDAVKIDLGVMVR